MMCDRWRNASGDVRNELEGHMANLRRTVTQHGIHHRQMLSDYVDLPDAFKADHTVNEASDPNQHSGTLEALHDTLSALGPKHGYNISHPEGVHHRVEYTGPGTTAQVSMHFAQALADHGAYDATSVRYGPDHHLVHFYDGNVPGYARVQKVGGKHIVDFTRAVD